jgi:hypothetical protein
MEGKFDGLEKYIKGKTDACQQNYEDLNNNMGKLSKKITGIDIENEVKGKVRKVLYNRITLKYYIIELPCCVLL